MRTLLYVTFGVVLCVGWATLMTYTVQEPTVRLMFCAIGGAFIGHMIVRRINTQHCV